MIAEDMGLDSDDPELLAKYATRVMTCRLMEATRADPPHLVDVCVLNDQSIGLWYTIEPYNEMVEAVLSGWDIKWRKFFTWQWNRIVDLRINSKNYQVVSESEWQTRIHDTNLKADGNRTLRQSKGIYWRRG